MFTRMSMTIATVLMTFGVVAFPAPAAAADGVAHISGTRTPATQAQADAAAAWTSSEFTGTRVGIPNGITVCGTLAKQVHSAALVDTTRTVTLYATAHCDTGAIVTVLHAGNEADSGTMAGTPTALGILGAQAYTVT